ncbi:MAG: ABC transporter ATP-binding protein [Bacteroidota bacterium]
MKKLEVREQKSILSSASITILPGEIVAITGPGGSGKSILLRFLEGIREDELTYGYQEYSDTLEKRLFWDFNDQKAKQCFTVPDDNYDLYLIDEPENGINLNQFHQLCRKVVTTNSVLVFVTHHLMYLKNYADMIMVLKYGEHKGTYTREGFFNNADPYIDYISKMGC